MIDECKKLWLMVRTNMLEQPNFADWLSKCFKSKLFSQKLSLKISTCLVPPAPQKSHSEYNFTYIVKIILFHSIDIFGKFRLRSFA